MARSWNNVSTQQLTRLHNEGCTLGQIAEALGMSEDTVSSKISRLRKDGKLKPRDAVKSGKDATVAALMAQNAKLRRKISGMADRLGNWNLLAKEFAAAASSQVQAPMSPRLNFKPKKAEQQMVAMLSDMHAGSRWRASLTDGYSEYDFPIFCRRLSHYGNEIINIAMNDRSKYGLKHLHVDSLGDSIQGILRIEDEVTNEFQIVPAVANITNVLFQWLLRLAEHFSTITYTGKSGNHGRLTKRTEASRSLEVNFDTLINLQLRALVQVAGMSDRIRINVPDGQITTITRLGHRIRLMHGDSLSGGGGIAGVPLFSMARDMLRAFRKEVRAGSGGLKLIEIGHFHTPNSFGGTLLMNGCLCGPNPWSFVNLGATDPASQTVYFTGENHVRGWSLDLEFDDAPEDHGFQYDEIDAMFADDYHDFRTLYGAGSC